MTTEPEFAALQEGHRKLEQGHREIKRQLAEVQEDQRRTRIELNVAAAGQLENNAATKRVEQNTATLKNDTAELLATFGALKGGFNVLVWIGRAAIPLAIVWGGIKAWTLGIFTGGKAL